MKQFLPGPLISKFLSMKQRIILSIFLINGTLCTDQTPFRNFLKLCLSMTQGWMDVPYFTKKNFANYWVVSLCILILWDLFKIALNMYYSIVYVCISDTMWLTHTCGPTITSQNVASKVCGESVTLTRCFCHMPSFQLLVFTRKPHSSVPVPINQETGHKKQPIRFLESSEWLLFSIRIENHHLWPYPHLNKARLTKRQKSGLLRGRKSQTYVENIHL